MIVLLIYRFRSTFYRLRVTKPTPNQGREFYACPNGRPGGSGSASNNGCNFFMWADTADARMPFGTSNDWSPSGSSSSRAPGVPSNRRSTGRTGRAGSAISADDGSVVSVGHVPLWPPPASAGSRSKLIILFMKVLPFGYYGFFAIHR